jgi:DNA-binding transcriptional LysR family regulator
MSGRVRVLAAALEDELIGTLHLGIIDSTVGDLSLPLATIIGEYSEKFPDVHLHLAVMSPHELQLGLLDTRLDLAIGSFPLRMNGLSYQPLYLEQHRLYCSDRHALFAEQSVSSEIITQQRMVSRGYWSQTELIRHGLKRSAATVESMEAQLILLLSGAYIGFLPEHYAKPWSDQGRIRPLLPDTFNI